MFRAPVATFASMLVLAGAAAPLRAEVRLPAIFSDHMVLQAGDSVTIWGWASPNERIEIAMAAPGKGIGTFATADQAGRWKTKFVPLAGPGPFTVTVKGKNTITINDVLVGEVWLGSGQSNMAMLVRSSKDVEKETADANYPQMRMFTEKSGPKTEASTECTGEWVVCSPETAGGFSATAYFFGREIYKQLKVPVGLINSSVGGTPIESWIAADVQRAEPKLKGFFEAVDAANAEYDEAKALATYEKQLAKWKEEAAARKAAGKPAAAAPRNPVEVRKRKGDIGGLFNGKIAPLVGYGIRGALWYQGEANTNDLKCDYYETQLPLLVTDWRKKWGQGDFPFAWVQLPNYVRAGQGWMIVREAMRKSLAVPNTGMAIAIDVGDPKDIHPKNKQEVGRRLALWALAEVYKKEGPSSGPLPTEQQASGDGITVKFSHADGLKTRDGKPPRGFELAGTDNAWKPAEAKIDGATVVVTSAEVKAPSAVRYAWRDNPDVNLVNGADLPASPFGPLGGK
jgi:sialate O-acetylesterase